MDRRGEWMVTSHLARLSRPDGRKEWLFKRGSVMTMALVKAI